MRAAGATGPLSQDMRGLKAVKCQPEVANRFKQEELAQGHISLLSWYDNNHRIMPWRRTPHSKKAGAIGGEGEGLAVQPAPADLPEQQFAYYVWVSEVMLQQTQVVTVIPYFQRWVAKWPTARALAAASIEEVNAMWAGLGYYRRARYLLEGAKYITDKLKGQFPRTAKELLAIPGVGPYTSAAVASIVFGQPVAVVDGNVIRVVSRLRVLPGDPTKLGATHTALAQELLDTSRPGCFNQAIMELGATVCRPANPDCEACPLASMCMARQQWLDYLAKGGAPDLEDAPRVTNYPGKKETQAKREIAVAVCVVEVICRGGVHCVNIATGLIAGMDNGNQQQDPEHRKHSGKVTRKASVMEPRAEGEQAPASKRQRTIFDFTVPKAKQGPSTARDAEQRDAQGGGPPSGSAPASSSGPQPQPQPQSGSSATASRVSVAQLLAAGHPRFRLLVQRPAEGLLAGLWEFTGVEFSEEEGKTASSSSSSLKERQRLTDARLTWLLGGPAVYAPSTSISSVSASASLNNGSSGRVTPTAMKVLARHDAGTYVHVFSHIRQTNYVERLTLLFDGDTQQLEDVTKVPVYTSAAAPAATNMATTSSAPVRSGNAHTSGPSRSDATDSAPGPQSVAATAAGPLGVAAGARSGRGVGGRGFASSTDVPMVISSDDSNYEKPERRGSDGNDSEDDHPPKPKRGQATARKQAVQQASKLPIGMSAGPASDAAAIARKGQASKPAGDLSIALPAMKWVKDTCMSELGLSAGVRKILKLACGE